MPHRSQAILLVNRCLLVVERLGQNYTMSENTFNRVTEPTVTQDGQRSPGLRFGNPRLMGILLVLTLFVHIVDGFTHA